MDIFQDQYSRTQEELRAYNEFIRKEMIELNSNIRELIDIIKKDNSYPKLQKKPIKFISGMCFTNIL